MLYTEAGSDNCLGVIPSELQLEYPEEDTGVNHSKACLDHQVYYVKIYNVFVACIEKCFLQS